MTLARHQGLLATLSHRAVARVAAAAGHATAAELTRMLYAAGSLAVGPRALAGYDPRRIDHVIASATRMSGLRHSRGEYWHVVQCNSDEDRHPVDGSVEDGPAAGGSPDGSRWVHKVYVSPRPQDLLPVLTVVADVAAELAAHSFKVGGTAAGRASPRQDRRLLRRPRRRPTPPRPSSTGCSLDGRRKVFRSPARSATAAWSPGGSTRAARPGE